MTDRSIAIHTAISCLLWPIGFSFVLIGLATKWELGQLGLLLAMIAGVLNIKGFFCAFQKRERNAFELGRDYGEHIASVRQLH